MKIMGTFGEFVSLTVDQVTPTNYLRTIYLKVLSLGKRRLY